MTRIFTRLAVATLATTCSTMALAQAGTPATAQAETEAATSDDEIVVTAQKREQRIEDVPITVTALTGARMASIGVNSLSEVAAYIPVSRFRSRARTTPAS